MNNLLSYVIESFFDSRQEKLNQLNTPEKLKSSDVIEYVRSNMKGSKTKQGAFLREGALYFLNAMAKEGGALDRGKPGTVAPGYAFEGGKREYGRVRGDSPLRKIQRPLIVPEVDYPGVPDARLQDVVVAEALALFRAWSNRNKPRFFDYKLSKPMTGDTAEVEELMELYQNHNRRFMRIHQLVAENNETQPIYFDKKKGKLPIGTEGIQTGITITRPPQAMWICLKLRKKAGASWAMYTNSVAKLGSMLNRAGMPSMVSTYGKLWDLWTILPDEMSAPDAYDAIGAIDGISRVGRTTKGVAFRTFLMDSVLIDESTFSNNRSIFPLSLHIHHGESKVATLQKGEGNQEFTKDTGLSMIPATGTLAQFDVGIDNHPLQAMFNAPDLVARVYRFARTAQIIPQLQAGLPTIEIDSEPSNKARDYWTSLKQMDGGDFYEGELKQIPAGRDITIEFDGEKAYLTGFPNDRKLTNLIQTEEFEQLCDKPATAFARIGGMDANALATFISQLDPSDFDEKRVREAFQDRILTIWGLSCTLDGEFEPFTPISDVSGRFIRAAKQAKPDDIEEMLAVSPEGLIGTVEPSEDRKEEKLIFGERTTPVVVLGYEKASVQNQEARVIIVGKVVEEAVDILVPGVRKPTRKAGKERREQYQEVARVGAFSGFNYDDRKDLLTYMESLNYQTEHEGDILIDPVEANIIFEMSYKGLLADKQMWRYNRTGKRKEVGVKQDLPAGGERFVKGVKTRFIMEPKEKNAIAQYNNPKIIGYRSEMGREEQRIYPMLIPSSDVTYGVALKSNPPDQLSKYKNFVEKDNSPLIAALGFTDEKFAKEDLGVFRSLMKEKHGASTVVVQSGKTLVAHKKGAKIGETCATDGCGAPKAFSPPAELRQDRAADEGPSVTFNCEVCGRQSYQRDRRNPLVSVEETEGDMKLATNLLRYMEYDLSDEVKPFLHTNWPSWYRRSERDLIVRGLERFDYTGVIEGLVNKTGSTYYNTLFNIAKRNNGGPLIKNRVQHQELAMLYSLCHNDLELIVAWPNATSSGKIEDFEKELEASGTIVYQKEVSLPRNGAEVLCMQMYAGESFLSKKQCQKKALASGWEKTDKAMGAGRKLRVYLYYNNSENNLRGKAAKRKEELRSLFKTSDSDRKSYIHTADNAVQVTEYAQVFFNDNSINLLNNNDLEILLPEKPYKTWLMMNSVKKYIQQELGSLFLLSSQIKSGSAAFLHGIRRTGDIDIMIDDRRLGPEVKQKMEALKELMPWTDSSLAYSSRDNEDKFWNFETYVPGKTFYEKRSEMIHNPEYHAYFCGLKVENAEAFLYMRMSRIARDARPRPVADMIMINEFIKEGRFKELKSKYKLILPVGTLRKTVTNRFYDKGGIQGWYKTVRYFIQERYKKKYTIEEIRDMLNAARTKTKPNPLDSDAIEERLLADVEGSFTDESETRRNPGRATVVITVPHALHAGSDAEQHWCDWSAAPAGRQIDKIMSKDHKTILHLADKKRTEIDYNRVASADTKWQYRLDDYIAKASMLLDIHSFPPDDVMWAGYDFVLFNSSEWPQQRQMEQAKLQDHLVKKGYKVFMDIADHRNYIQEKGIKAGIPSFLIEFNEELSLKDSCNDLIEGLEELLPKSNPWKTGGPGERWPDGHWWEPDPRGKEIFESTPALRLINRYMNGKASGYDFDKVFNAVAKYMKKNYNVTYRMIEPERAMNILYLINPEIGFFTGANPGTYDEDRGVVFFNTDMMKMGERRALIELGHETGAVITSQMFGGKKKIPTVDSIGRNVKEPLTHLIDKYTFEMDESTTPSNLVADAMEAVKKIQSNKENPVLPMKHHGWFPKSAYINEAPGEEERHNEIQAHQKKHDALVQSIMKNDFRKTWTWNRPVAEDKKEAEMKALKKAKKKADKELGDFKICRADCLYCSIEQNKTNPTPHFFPGDAVKKYPWLKYADLIKTNSPSSEKIFILQDAHLPNIPFTEMIEGEPPQNVAIFQENWSGRVGGAPPKGFHEKYNLHPDAKVSVYSIGKNSTKGWKPGTDQAKYIDDVYAQQFMQKLPEIPSDVTHVLINTGHSYPIGAELPYGANIIDVQQRQEGFPASEARWERQKPAYEKVMKKISFWNTFKTNPSHPEGYYHVTQQLDKLKRTGLYRKHHGRSPQSVIDGVHAHGNWETAVGKAKRDSQQPSGKYRTEVGIVVIPFDINQEFNVHKTRGYDDAVIIEIPEGETIPPEKLQFLSMEEIMAKQNPPKDLYDVFEEWCSLVNMTNKELETFLNSNWGKVAGLSKQEAKNWNDIKSGRVSGRRILKMREKIGFSGPNDQIKSQNDISKAWEKALKNWTGPSGDSMKGETDWDWCKRQVRFNKRAGAFPYNQNAEERKGALVKKQKTQNQPSRRLLSLWVWGHDPWRWAYDNDVARMPKCPDTAWVGNKEKRKYGKIEVIAGPKKNFMLSLPYLYSQILRGVVYSEEGLEPKENPPAENITWTKMPPRKMELPGPAAGTPLETMYELRGVDEDGHTVTIKTTKYNTDTEYRNKDGQLFTNTAVTSQEWLKGLGVEDYFYVVGIEASKKMIGLGQAAYIQLAKIVPAVLSTNHSESSERAWQGVERNAAQHGLVVHRRKVTYPMSKAKGDEFDGEGFRYDRVLMKDTKENPPVFPEPERISKVKGGRYKMDSGQDVSGMHFSDVVILGSDKSINVEWQNQEEEPEPKPAPRSGLRRIRFNMLRPSKFDGYKDAWIVASETSKGHIYSLSVEVQTTLTLKTFPGKKSEPRLRPETYGSLHPLNKIGEITIKSSGKKHPLYDRVFVMDSKENKGRGSGRLYGITVKYARTLHPELDVFTSKSMVTRLQDRRLSSQAEPRQMGKILSRMVREGLIQDLRDGSYRNTEARYQEYLAEQEEEPKDNPRTKKGRKVPKRYLKGLNSVERAIAKYEIDKGYEYDIDDPEAYEFWKSDIMAKARGMENQPSTWKLKFIKKYGPLPKGKNIVNRLAKATGIKKKYIQKAYDKGLAAWRGGHRPGVQQHQWAVGRAYALVMGAPTSTGKGKPDFKLAVEAGVRNEKGKLLI